MPYFTNYQASVTLKTLFFIIINAHILLRYFLLAKKKKLPKVYIIVPNNCTLFIFSGHVEFS